MYRQERKNIECDRSDSGKEEKINDLPDRLLDKKISGALNGVELKIKRDSAAEDCLLSDIEDDDLKKEALIIDCRRNFVAARLASFLGQDNSGQLAKASQALEGQLTNRRAKDIYNRLAEKNRYALLDYLVESGASYQEDKIISHQVANEINSYLTYYSGNGFLMELTNPQEVRHNDRLDIGSGRDCYRIISPDGSIKADNLDHDAALSLISEESKKRKDRIVAPKKMSYHRHSENGALSVWQELCDIFKENCLELGYAGGLAETAALDRWAEIKTAAVIGENNLVPEKIVPADHSVSLEDCGDSYRVTIV